MSERVVVCDASCLVVLERIDKMLLLQQLFNEVKATQGVALEFGKALPEWIKIVEVKDREKTKVLELSLDKGEASSIAYCLEQTEEMLLIIDEK